MSSKKSKLEVGYIPDDPNYIETDDSVQNKHTKKNQEHKKKSVSKKTISKIKSQSNMIEKLTMERDEYKDRLLRNLAEIDNFRKRVKKEKEEYQKYALGDFLKELLVITDNLERALKVKDNESTTDSLISGVEMIYKQFMEILSKNGVKEIVALSKPFDPNIHQAISKEELDSIKEPTIVEVYQKGYMYNERLLRPSMTKVAIPPDPDTIGVEQE